MPISQATSPWKTVTLVLKQKFSITKGYGILKTAFKFAEVIPMDLVGGQKSLSPVTADSSIQNTTWFLLAVDELTSYKWAWPKYSKKNITQ